MNIKHYLDSTYLKTAEQANVSKKENIVLVQNFVQETIDEKFKLVMIRPDKVALAKKQIESQNSKVLIGTVIGFPEGTNTIEEKLSEAKQAVNDGADELDFVVNFEAFKSGEISLVKEEVYQGTQFVLQNNNKQNYDKIQLKDVLKKKFFNVKFMC